MDGDVFSKVTRIGRDAADAALNALDGGAWNPFCAERCLDVLFASAVTAALLDADRLSPRQPAGVRGVARALAWQRSIDVHIAVEDPNRWQSVAPALQKLLAFMTDISRSHRPKSQARVLAMYATYRQEICEFFARARPVLKPRPRRLRKENRRDLFAAVG